MTFLRDPFMGFILLGILLLPSTYAHGAFIEVFSADFESGAPAEFSTTNTSSAGIGAEAVNQGLSTYLGRFTSDASTTLTLNGLAPHTAIRLQFDLYLFDTWDGSSLAGPDFFSVNGSGLAFAETFTNHHGSSGSPNQTYQAIGDVFLNSTGTALSGFGDPLSIQAFFGLGPTGTNSNFEVAHTSSTFSVTFGGPTSQPDELWAIDNVRVFLEQGEVGAVPEPTSFALLGMGVTGLCGYRWRRKRQQCA